MSRPIFRCFCGEATGLRSAIIDTPIERARRHSHNPEAHLADILDRLPVVTHQDDLPQLLPSRLRCGCVFAKGRASAGES